MHHRQNPSESTSITVLVTQYFLGGNEENNNNLSQESQSPDRDSNYEQPAHELEVLTATQRR
jgi:hypothetical protein